jgi:hypothetical protein
MNGLKESMPSYEDKSSDNDGSLLMSDFGTKYKIRSIDNLQTSWSKKMLRLN